jgi:hypothetical protein
VPGWMSDVDMDVISTPEGTTSRRGGTASTHAVSGSLT